MISFSVVIKIWQTNARVKKLFELSTGMIIDTLEIELRKQSVANIRKQCVRK